MPKARLNDFDWTFVQGSTVVLWLNFRRKNTHHLRYIIVSFWKDNWEFRLIQLGRQQKSYTQTTLEVSSELQAVTAEVNSLNNIIDTLPAGELKDENVTKRKRAELKKHLLEERQKDYG